MPRRKTSSRKNADAVVFLGGGRIASAIVAGLRRVAYRKPILIHDGHAEKLRRLKHDFGVAVEADIARALRRAHLLLLAVRPESVGALLAGDIFASGVNSRASSRAIIGVSLAAGIPLARLRALAPRGVLWARAMPSPVCRMSLGLTALHFDLHFPRAARREVRELFSRIGMVVEIPESQFDAFTSVFSSSHGYHALAALADAGVKIGLSRKTALDAAAHALGDGINAWRSGNASLASLLKEAATPGGTAEATLAAADRHGYRTAVEKGVRAGLARARRNSREF